MYSDFNLEVSAKILQQLIPLNEGIQIFCLSREYEKRPEKIDENCVHDSKTIECDIDSDVAITKYSKKLHDEVFKL